MGEGVANRCRGERLAGGCRTKLQRQVEAENGVRYYETCLLLKANLSHSRRWEYFAIQYCFVIPIAWTVLVTNAGTSAIGVGVRQSSVVANFPSPLPSPPVAC